MNPDQALAPAAKEKGGKNKRENGAIPRTALIYLLFGALWILFSDAAASAIAPILPVSALAQTLKGLLFVGASALLIHFLQKRDIQKIAESEQRYKLLFEDNPHPMWVYDLETLAFLMVNDAAINRYGFTREEFLGMTIRDIRPTEEVPALLENMADKTSAMQWSSGWKHRRKDGSLMEVEISSHSMTYGDRPARLVLVNDVTERRLAERAMEESEERYRTLFEASGDAIVLSDLNANIVLCNRRTAEMLGFDSVDDIVHRSVFDFIVPEHHANANEKTRLVLERGQLKDFEFDLLKRDGTRLSAEASYVLLKNADGMPRLLLSIIRDITERKRTRERLAYQAELLSNVQDAIVGTDENLRVTYWNRAAAELFGWAEEEALGRETKDLFQTHIPGSSRGETLKNLVDMGRFDGEAFCARKDGVYINVHIRSVTLKDSHGGFKGLVASIRDITERRQAEMAMRRSEQILRDAQSIAQLGSWTADLKSGLLYVSPESARLAGWEPGVHKVEALLEAAHPDDREHIRSAWLDALRDVSPYNIEYRILVNGEVRWLHVTAKIAFGADGTPISAVGVLQDITERKQAKMARERLLNVLEASLNEIYIFDPDSLKFEYANSGALRNLGYSFEELRAMNPVDLKPEFTEASFRETIAPLLRGEKPILNFETTHRRADASLYPVEVHLQLVETGDERAFLAVINDITERKLAEEQLRASEERFRNTLDNMLEGCQIIGFNWQYLYVNDAVARQGRIAKEALLNRTMMDMYPGIENTELFAVLQDCMEKRITRHMENLFVFPDGASGWFELSIQPVPEGIFILSIDITERKLAEEQLRLSEERFRLFAENVEEGFWITDVENGQEIYLSPAIEKIWERPLSIMMREDTFLESILPEDHHIVLNNMERQKEGKHTDMEYRIRRPDGSVRWIWDRAFPILNDDGTVRIVAGLVTDITERKEAEGRIRLHLQRITALNEIDRAISSSFDMRLSLDVLLQETLSQLKVDAACILLLNPVDQSLEFMAGKGFRSSAIHHSRLHLGTGFAGTAGLERKVVHVSNLLEAGALFTRNKLLRGEEFIEYFGVPLIAKGSLKGVLEIFHRSPLRPDPDWLNYLETLGGQAAIAVDNAQLFEGLQKSNQELITAYDATIAGWSHAMDLRDKETEGHTQRVTEITQKLAERMGVSSQEMIHIRRGALLHDIGKLGVPDHILLKPDKLTEEEWEIMRRHPANAYKMLLPINYLRPALDIPYCHHEKWDGSGYPRGLKGEQIPLAARIFAIVDVWDALRSDRPYRPGWSSEKVKDYIQEQSGKHFDPQVVEAFMKLLDEMPDTHS
ncbi:MAG: hypothetical protein DPW18_19125 [Chloroflexi bacterium]|nr:hypothetical protein [Chloroflexota bacterium]MDL1944974.1 PAS domain S-box protein [Chloroflexi bacterium CFX2]